MGSGVALMVPLPVPIPGEKPSDFSLLIPSRSWGIASKSKKLPESGYSAEAA